MCFIGLKKKSFYGSIKVENAVFLYFGNLR